jgi:uncharacterized membrane protein HdeD (DUF308 family)
VEEQSVETRGSSRLSRPESAAWGGAFFLGLLWCILGWLCVAATGLASLAAVFYVGAFLAIAGLLGIVFGFRGGGAGVIILGILSLVVGALLFIHPGEGMAALTLLLIGYFLVAGVFRAVTSIIDRYDNWGWDFLYGVSTIAIGIIAARAWPLSTFWLLGMLAGAELIVRGVTMMAAAVTVRRGLRALRERRAT